ncbi:MAG: hypothetical protein A3H27_02690 [Acidobacteria bacterium RIFCSPLOWO2_02_FULL_59_13]|nr:MAG: hypothetical protein A3H27_02690 [Acidobacteria bacterium RIFCSPLOWO2_02_FULL_59_13]
MLHRTVSFFLPCHSEPIGVAQGKLHEESALELVSEPTKVAVIGASRLARLGELCYTALRGDGESMTNEEFEKRMEFIIEHQARFASDIQLLQEAQARTEEMIARLANVTAEGFKDVNAKIDALVDSHIRLSEAQSRTDDTLRSLIAVVDRYFREGRDGQTGQ